MPEQFTQGPSILQSDIINNLTTDSSTKPLSAAQGKVLGDRFVNLGDVSGSTVNDFLINFCSAFAALNYSNMPIPVSATWSGHDNFVGTMWKDSSNVLFNVNSTGRIISGKYNISAGTISVNDMYDKIETINSKITPQALANLNNATAAGKYFYGVGASNSPDVNYSGSVNVIPSSNDLIYQFAINTTNNAFIRVYKNSAWTSWEKLALNSNKSNLLTVDSASVSGSSIAAGGVSDFYPDVTKSGYTPIGIVGTQIATGGATSLVHAFLSSTTNATVRLRNNGSSAVTPGTIYVFVLYVKN